MNRFIMILETAQMMATIIRQNPGTAEKIDTYGLKLSRRISQFSV